jgi:hypothetical protein
MEAIVQVDEQGRVKLPAPILDALHVGTPGQLRAHASTGKLELTPVQTPSSVTFIQENGVLVAANTTEFDAVSAIEAVRDERL